MVPLPDLGAQRSAGDAPQVFDELAIVVRCHRTLTRQSRPHVTHLATAHRVGLAGEGEGAAARLADRSGSQVQVADGVGVPGAVGALVETHRPAAHEILGLADHLSRRADVLFRYPGHGADRVGAVLLQETGHHFPALGEFGDEIGVGVAVLDDQVQQSVEQRQIGSRRDLQEQIRLVGGRGAARVDDDQLCPGLDPVHHAQEQDRVAVGHVGADDEKDVGALEVLV